jgi:hypothetical protein
MIRCAACSVFERRTVRAQKCRLYMNVETARIPSRILGLANVSASVSRAELRRLALL